VKKSRERKSLGKRAADVVRLEDLAPRKPVAGGASCSASASTRPRTSRAPHRRTAQDLLTERYSRRLRPHRTRGATEKAKGGEEGRNGER
jgi:hypothetical protein